MSNGEPLPGGTITFVPEGGGSVASVWINPDGTYEIEAPLGECKITIDNRNVGVTPAPPVGAGGGGNAPPAGSGPKGGSPGGVMTGPPGGAGKSGAPPKDKGGEIGNRMKEAGQSPTGSGSVQPGTLKPINAKYYKTETSGLSLGVKSGSQSFDIKLDP